MKNHTENDTNYCIENHMDCVIKMAKKIYPAEIRYRNKHPTISFRVSRDEWERIKGTCETSGKSISQVIKETMLGYTKEQEKTFEKGMEAGFEQAINEYMIAYPCAICGEGLIVQSLSKDHITLAEYMKEHGWKCAKCAE